MSETPHRSDVQAAWQRLTNATTALTLAAMEWDEACKAYVDAQRGKLVEPLPDSEKAQVWDEAIAVASKELAEAYYYDGVGRKKYFSNFWRAGDWIRKIANPYKQGEKSDESDG